MFSVILTILEFILEFVFSIGRNLGYLITIRKKKDNNNNQPVCFNKSLCDFVDIDGNYCYLYNNYLDSKLICLEECNTKYKNNYVGVP